MDNKKVIIHQKYDMNLTTGQLIRLHNSLKDALPEDYIVVTTPTDISKISGDDILISIDAKPYTLNELTEIISKATV